MRSELAVARVRCRALFAAALAAPMMLMATPTEAEGLFDFLFGGFGRPQREAAPQPGSYDPYASQSNAQGYGAGSFAPAPRAAAAEGPAFCVRSCDGKYFPLMRGAAPAERMCQAFCPASPVKVYFGSSIEEARAADGERYPESRSAFAYRKALRADCTCNGRDPAGLAAIDLALDTSLRAGDVIATPDGLLAYSGVRAGNEQAREFTPVASYPGLTAEIRARLAGMRVAPARAETVSDPLAAEPGETAPASQPARSAKRAGLE